MLPPMIFLEIRRPPADVVTLQLEIELREMPATLSRHAVAARLFAEIPDIPCLASAIFHSLMLILLALMRATVRRRFAADADDI